MSKLISVNEARKFLGKDADQLTDMQVEQLIQHLEFMVHLAIDSYKNSLNVAEVEVDTSGSTNPGI